MPQLHDDVEGGVEHHVGDEHCEEVCGKVQGDDRPGSGRDPLGRQAPVDSVHHQQEGQPVRVEGTQTTEITTQQGPGVVAAYHPNPLANVAVHLEPAKKCKQYGLNLERLRDLVSKLLR